MEAVTLVMPRQQARKAYLEYRALVTANPATGEEDTALKNAYRELSRGNPVIDLPATMKAVGLGSDFYPKLAIGRADKAHCWVESKRDGSAVFTGFDPSAYFAGRPAKSTRFEVPRETFTGWSLRWDGQNHHNVGRPSDWAPYARAITPTIPALLRPKSRLDNFCILWEAVWRREVPRDPMLLKPLGWPFFAVVAVWDLTELERAVLRGRV